MNVELINPFIVTTVKTLTTMAQTTPVAGKPGVKEGSASWGAVTGIIGMAGESVNGNLVLSFDEPCILDIVSKMLMDNFTEINKDVIDAVGELTNVISGGTKAELNTKGFQFNMATPVVITGKDVSIKQLTKGPVITIPFTTPAGKFVVEANLEAKNK